MLRLGYQAYVDLNIMVFRIFGKIFYRRYFFLAQFSCERDFQFLKNFILAHFLNDTNFLLAHFPGQWLGENGMTHRLYESLDFHPIIDSENVPKLNLYNSKNVPKQNFWENEDLSHKKTVPKRNTPCNRSNITIVIIKYSFYFIIFGQCWWKIKISTYIFADVFCFII